MSQGSRCLFGKDCAVGMLSEMGDGALGFTVLRRFLVQVEVAVVGVFAGEFRMAEIAGPCARACIQFGGIFPG